MVQFILSSHMWLANLIAVKVRVSKSLCGNNKILLLDSKFTLCFHQLCWFPACSEFVFYVAHVWLEIFFFVLIFQWNRKAQILKRVMNWWFWTVFYLEEGRWLLITPTDFSIDSSLAFPIVQPGMWFAEQAYAKKVKTVCMSHIPCFLLKKN